MVDRKDKLLNILLFVQGIYSLVTAVWGLVHIDSFMAVTGPKTDVWLVKTVSALLVPISVCLLSYLFTKTGFLQVTIIGIGSATALAAIDFYYALSDRISKIYLADGIAEVVFIICWIIVVTTKGKATNRKNN